MSLPEITALCRVLARSDARDHGQQVRNLERLRELRTYLADHSDAGTTACLDAAIVLIEAMARGSRLERPELLELVCQLMATIEKNWSGPDPDAVIAGALYAPPAAGEGDVRVIQSTVHGTRTTVLGEADFAEAQSRIDRLKRTPRINEMVLGELLIELGHLSAADLQAALDEQMQDGALLGEVLVQRGLVPRATIEETVALQRELRGERTRASLANLAPPVPAPPPAAPRGAKLRQEPEPRMGLRLDRGPRPGISLEDKSRDHQLGAILLRQGAITSAQLEQALSIQRATGLRIGESLVDMEATTWPVIEKAVELQKRLRQAAGVAAWGRP